MKKSYAFLLTMLIGLMGFSAQALRTTNLHLSQGSAAVLMTYVYAQGDYVFKQSLNEGDNIIELADYSYVYLFPAPGVETISVDPEDNCVYRSGAGTEQYTIMAGYSLKEKYTVTTSGGQVSKPATVITLAPGSQAQVLELNERTYEYTVHADLAEGSNTVEFEMESTAVPGTVPFYYLCGKDGYILDRVTDADGNEVSLKENSELGTYIELTAFTYLPAYSVTTKERPIPEGDPTFILADGSRAYWQLMSGGTRHTLTPGNNYATLGAFDIIRVYPVDGHHYTSFTDATGAAMTVNTNGYVEINASYNFKPPYRITTVANEGPDPTFTIDIDDPDAVECAFFPSYKTISLRAGVNTITFNEYGERRIQLATKGMSYTPFYSVTVNGVEEPSSYEHFIDVTDGMQIVARVNYPQDTEYTYTLAYSDQADDFWTGIEVDGQPLLPEGNTFKAKAGAKVALYNIDATDWVINSITLPNGSRHTRIADPYTPLTFTATADGTISVDARRAVTLNVTLNIVSGAEKIKVINGNFNTGRELRNLVNGTNAVTIKDNVDYLVVRHLEEGGIISSITYTAAPGEELKAAEFNGYFNYYTVNGLRDGAVVNIIAGDEDYANTCSFFIDNAEGVTFRAEAGRSFTLADGNNTIIFNESENGAKGFAIEGLPETARLWCNGVEADDPTHVRLAQDGVYRLYTAAAATYAVTFDVFDGYAATGVTLDGQAVASVAEPIEAPEGAVISFGLTTPEGALPYAAANGDELSPDTDGTYTITVTADTVITIGTETDSIDTITAADSNDGATYFDLTGRRIDASRVAAGIYVRVAADGSVAKVAVK